MRDPPHRETAFTDIANGDNELARNTNERRPEKFVFPSHVEEGV